MPNWTLPVTRASLYTVSSTVWNNEHVNNLLECSTIYTWNPTWTTTGTAPVLGNGTLVGHFIKIGKLATARIQFVAGTTTTFGTGEWSFTLPVTSDSITTTWSGRLFDSGSQLYTVTAELVTTTTIKIVYNQASYLSQGSPFTWAANGLDQFILTGQFFTASV